ncbi:DUF6368 family protein [Streptomyces sp. NPDC085614]|uniref:DUF6368 family protein n=1 Tax=Streptomyces sp. NPDC085614 TaxID=3365733 RepID=UPI0037D71D2A
MPLGPSSRRTIASWQTTRTTRPSRPHPLKGLAAGVSEQVNHALLGHLALVFARRLNAMIDFDGVLGQPLAIGRQRPRTWPERGRWWHCSRALSGKSPLIEGSSRFAR